ncbi:hypothetical protein AF72_13395 [Xylella taiwanensis]|uniref:Uncharacterized protein n=1 Tax=Xylella taiwanensis TaxID=1444770 RepID=Z9JFK0_9GAMM|nr:hypothetical protein AB672_06410 [Xylella taiwanensis]EWS76959.1 hypothetical protein AF72_13395 [Xylella taiwanensis]
MADMSQGGFAPSDDQRLPNAPIKAVLRKMVSEGRGDSIGCLAPLSADTTLEKSVTVGGNPLHPLCGFMYTIM